MNLTIDGRDRRRRPGTTILERGACAGIDIPSLCQDDRLEPFAACRLCLVEVEGAQRPGRRPATARSPRAWSSPPRPPSLPSSARCCIDLLLATTARLPRVRSGRRLPAPGSRLPLRRGRHELQGRAPLATGPRDDNPFIAYDPGKCILCGRCVGICEQVQGATCSTSPSAAFRSLITTSFGRSMVETNCEMCGNCVRLSRPAPCRTS